MQAADFFEQLWRRYVQLAPQAQKIHDHVQNTFGKVVNDHVAFRTFDKPGYTLAALEPAFLQLGYRRAERYEFPDKHLEAYSYLPPNNELPFVFFSQLLCERLSGPAQAVIEELLAQSTSFASDPAERLLAGRPWALPSGAQYDALAAESAYAAWLLVWGLCANHFTVAVHRLGNHPSLEQVVESLQNAGFEFNRAGGLVKGSPLQLLEQASTVAEAQPLKLSDGVRSVCSCYYEFARRYHDEQGQLYQGFVAASASHIFESTTAGSGGSSLP